ncbi:MAG: hypothetical protein DYG89_02710 [Caldilinea sp. CFX5]|nr:hypothetical protein [Caldilinea sp. CFX5]
MTYVNRRTFVVKHDYLDEAITMLKEGSVGFNARVYRSHYGPLHTVAFEIEFADMAELEARWNAWFVTPEGAAFTKRWHAITEPGGQNEIWLCE